MTGILTITLNPAIDKSTSIAALVPEKKLRCSFPCFEPGGGGVNVARAIKKLGGEATACYLAGGYTGIFYTRLLEEEGVSTLVTGISGHTRENLVVADRSTGLQYRFGMPGPSITGKEWLSLLEKIEKTEDPSFIVASGSVPEGVPPDIFSRIGKIARQKKAKYIVDTSGVPLQYAAGEEVYFLKPNLSELCSLAGKDELCSNEEIITTARGLLQKGNIKALVISMGAAGALLVTNSTQLQITPPAVKRISTVGAGDSMVAGIVYSLDKGRSFEEAVKYGVACGTAATLNPGTGLCRKEDADRLYQSL